MLENITTVSNIEFSTVKDIILACAAVITTGLAVYGVRSWQVELQGRTNYEIARSLLKVTYKFRDTLSDLRAPFVQSHEFPPDYTPLDTDKRKESEAHRYIFINRLKPVSEALQEYDIFALEAEVIWGEEIKSATDQYRSIIVTLNVAINRYIIDIVSNVEEINYDSYVNNLRKVYRNQENDDITAKISTDISEIEKIIKPHLKRKK